MKVNLTLTTSAMDKYKKAELEEPAAKKACTAATPGLEKSSVEPPAVEVRSPYAAPPPVSGTRQPRPAAPQIMHPNGWGLHIDASDTVAMKQLVAHGRLQRTVAQHGVAVIRGLGAKSPQEVLRFVTDAMGKDPRLAPQPSDLPSPAGCPQIHLLGSPNSGGEYISASDAETARQKLDEWIAKPAEKSLLTDWHVDEPWESHPARFTILYAAISEGQVSTKFVSTAHFWKHGMRSEDRQVCESSSAVFEAPPWLPQEDAVSEHPLMRRTLAGEAMYICADSLRQVQGMSREESVQFCWRLTEECCVNDDLSVVAHNWEQYDFLVFDNFSMMHARVKYDQVAQNRLLYRMQMDGDAEGASETAEGKAKGSAPP